MHKYKKNRGKFTFSAIFLVFGLRRATVASVFPRISRISTDNKEDQCKSVKSVGMEKCYQCE